MSKRRVPDDSGSAPFRCGQLAVIGRPNVGKSTLVNALVGARITITSNRPQTTRHRIRGILTTNRAQLIFVDTPGFQTAHRSTLNERMNRAVRESLTDVDALVLVVEPSLSEGDRTVIGLLPLLSEIAALREFAAIVPISAEKGWQLNELTAEMVKLMPVGPALYGDDDLTDRDERFLAAEYIREKIFRLLGEE